MNGLRYIIRYMIVIICLCLSCNNKEYDKDEPHLPEDSTSEVVKVVSQSIKQDSVLRADSTSCLELTYSDEISVAKPELITINGRVIASVEAKGKVLTLPLTLEAATDYIVQITQEALVSKDKVKVKAFSLNFKTRATVDIAKVNTSLCNKYADETAKSLYKTFISVYGKQTFSGVWELFGRNDFVEQLFAFAGNYPAMISCDFSAIHTSDYSDIDFLKSYCRLGGIVSFGWQWLTPSQENYSPENYSADSDFSIKRAVNNTTWESLFVESDIDRVASCLQLFQQNGIPVVFSPMIAAQRHWWGQAEPPYFRELWKLLYDRLVVKHRLNNLIWVWTTDTQNMTEEQIISWYPGDEYVDIVAIAPNENVSRSLIDTFLLLNDTFEGKKMLAVAECVAIPNLDESYANGDTWLYFTAPSNFKVNTPDYWLSLMSLPEIIKICL